MGCLKGGDRECRWLKCVDRIKTFRSGCSPFVWFNMCGVVNTGVRLQGIVGEGEPCGSQVSDKGFPVFVFDFGVFERPQIVHIDFVIVPTLR